MPLSAADAAGAARLGGVQGRNDPQINKLSDTVRHDDLLVTVNKLIDQVNTGLLQRAYPIGSTYSTTVNANPSSVFAFGTWAVAGTISTSGTGATTLYVWNRTA